MSAVARPLRTPSRLRAPLRRAAPLLSLAVVLGIGGCNSPLSSVSSVPPPPPVADQARLRAYAEDLAPRYAEHPDDKVVAVRYASALRGLTENAQAVAVLQKLAIKYPQDMTVLGAYGKALADAGRLQEASAVLARSHTPERPNWSILSAQGSVADQMGDHKQAQDYYAAALKIVPNQPQVLSNLGLSYALEHQMPAAEDTLRQAAAQPGADIRVRQNLAMVLSARGKYAEAEEVARHDMAPIDAAESVADMRRTVARSEALSPIETPIRKVATAPARTRTAAVMDEGN